MIILMCPHTDFCDILIEYKKKFSKKKIFRMYKESNANSGFVEGCIDISIDQPSEYSFLREA